MHFKNLHKGSELGTGRSSLQDNGGCICVWEIRLGNLETIWNKN